MLFIVIMSRLSEVLGKNNRLQGVEINGHTKTCSLVADDTAVSIRGSQSGFDELNCLLDHFYEESGLRVNYTKTIIMKIGPWKNSQDILLSEKDFIWLTSEESVTYLGVDISPSEVQTYNKTDMAFESSETFLTTWIQGLRYQSYSVIGRFFHSDP